MKNELTLDQEFNIRELIEAPHYSYVIGDLVERKKVACNVLYRKENEILLIDRTGFLIDSIFAGLSENQIEYIAKNSPKDYKINLLKIIQDKAMMRGIIEIAKAMDEDLGRGDTKNQGRVKNVIQYIKDNKTAFEF